MFTQDVHLPDNAHASVRMRKDQKPYSVRQPPRRFRRQCQARSCRGTNWDKRLKHTDAEPYEGGVRVTPPPLLKNSPQEAPGNKGGWQGEFHTTPQMYLIAFRRARAAVRTGTSGLDKRRWDRMKVACA